MTNHGYHIIIDHLVDITAYTYVPMINKQYIYKQTWISTIWGCQSHSPLACPVSRRIGFGDWHAI